MGRERLLRTIVCVATIVIGASGLEPGQAFGAEPAPARARAAESFREARAAFERGDFAAAAAAFEEAARHEPHAATLLNAADARERIGDFARAADDCERALSVTTDASGTNAYRSSAEERLARLRAKIGKVRFEAPRTVFLHVDGGAPFTAPASRWLMPGTHVVTADDPTMSRSLPKSEIVVVAGGEALVDLRRPSEPTRDVPKDAPKDAPKTSRSVPAGAWIALGGAAAALGVGITFGFLTSSARDDYNAAPSAETRDAFYRNRLVTNLALGAAALSAVGAITIWTLSKRSVVVTLAPSTTQLAVTFFR